jgi:hypothetical protein
MPFYRDHVYPHLVRMLGDPKPIREVRHRIQQGGFGIEQIEAAYIAEFPKSSSYCWWGSAKLYRLWVRHFKLQSLPSKPPHRCHSRKVRED